METGSGATKDTMRCGSNGLGPARRATWVALAAALMTPPMAAAVGGQEAKLTVSATVLKRASMKVVAQPASVVVTSTDIARGYVDVPTPSSILVHCNSPQGFMLDFASSGEGIRQTLVRGLGADVQVGQNGGAIAVPACGRGTRSMPLDLSFRFFLSEAARTGVQPWPVHLSVSPL